MRKHLKVLNFTASIKHKEKWLRRFLGLPNGIPSHDRFRRVFMLIDAARFEACFLAWTRRVFSPPEQETLRQIAVDGKTVRRSFDRRKGMSSLHVVSAFARQSGLPLAQRVVAEKSGEAEVLLPLLQGLDLAGALISPDALYARMARITSSYRRGDTYQRYQRSWMRIPEDPAGHSDNIRPPKPGYPATYGAPC